MHQNSSKKSVDELYRMTFDAHYNLATIHPWADGNGRMARLVMNMLQFEFGLIPAKILKEDKEEYIKALIATHEEDNLDIFGDFIFSLMHNTIVVQPCPILLSKSRLYLVPPFRLFPQLSASLGAFLPPLL